MINQESNFERPANLNSNLEIEIGVGFCEEPFWKLSD